MARSSPAKGIRKRRRHFPNTGTIERRGEVKINGEGRQVSGDKRFYLQTNRVK